MSLAMNKIILAGATSNTAGAYFQTSVVNAVATGNGTVVPAVVASMVVSCQYAPGVLVALPEIRILFKPSAMTSSPYNEIEL